MIGNTILFIEYDADKIGTPEYKGQEFTGLVVDAFTEVTGTVRGNNDVFLGFGGGSTHGSTKSNRKYKVETYSEWDTDKKFVRYKDIDAWQLREIISFALNANQETHEEKIGIKK